MRCAVTNLKDEMKNKIQVGIDRITELSNLRHGWLNGRGNKPDEKGLEWFMDKFNSKYNFLLPIPYMYPTAEGGLIAEWSFDGYEISLTIDVANKLAEYHEVHITDEADKFVDMDLTENEDWMVLNEMLMKIYNK